MKCRTRFALAASVITLSACASAPIHYYTLVAPAERASPSEPQASFLVEVLPIGIPGLLDQPQLVVRQGDSSLLVLEGERWAGPIGDELRGAISAGLTHRLATQDIAGLAKPADRPVIRVKVQIRRFDAWPGQRASIDADWSLGYADDPESARLVCHGQFEQPAPGGYPELVQAQQHALGALTEKLGMDVRTWVDSRQPGGKASTVVRCS